MNLAAFMACRELWVSKTPKSCPAQRLLLSVGVTDLVAVSHHVNCAREEAHASHDCEKTFTAHLGVTKHLVLCDPGENLCSLVSVHS